MANTPRAWPLQQGFTGARPGVLQGTYTYVLQTDDGQIATTHSVSAGLDYPAVGPEHALLAEQHRAEYTAVSDDAALEAARTLARTEGIIPALESAHALAELIDARAAHAPRRSSSSSIFPAAATRTWTSWLEATSEIP